MHSVLVEIIVIFCLLLANGVFAMAEIAVVSSREARLKKLADEGSIQAANALALCREPARFLSTVQIGITLIGILAGTFGGASLSEKLAGVLAEVPALAPYSKAIAVALVVGAITYCSLIIGELVPKRIGMNNPERRVMWIATPMNWLARIAAPFSWFLTRSSTLILKLLGLDREVDAPPSEEEVSHLIEEGTSAGVFHKSERAMVEGVLRLDERPVTEIMTRRNKIVWLNINEPDEINWRKIVTSGHSDFPVFEGTRDHVVGLISVKALWANAAFGVPNHIRTHLTKPLFVPDTLTAVQLLDTFRKSGKHLALVTDEFGSIQGLATLIDVMEAIVGALPEPGDRREPDATQRDDQSWLVDGAMAIEDVKRRFGLRIRPEQEGNFQTLGGLVMDRLGHIPTAGETFEWEGWQIEVLDMDRHRVDKVALRKIPSSGS